MLEMALCHDGHQVFSAVSVESALLQLRVLRPHLILLGEDGQRGASDRAVEQMAGLSAAPVLLLDGSGSTTGSEVERPAHPIGAREICVAVARCLNQS